MKFDALGTSKHEEGKSLSKKNFAILISTLRRFNRANKKKSVIYTLKNEFAFSDRSFTCLAGARWQDLMSHIDFLFIFGQCGDNGT